MRKFRNRLPWHVQLMTGSMKKVRTLDGKIVQEFVPTKTNRFPTLSSLFERNPNLSQQEVLEKEGLVQPSFSLDGNVFSKKRSEKRQLKYFKKMHKSNMKKAGLNHKTRLNISEPMTLRRG